MAEVVKVERLIVALRNEKGSYNKVHERFLALVIVALRNEKGSYNTDFRLIYII